MTDFSGSNARIFFEMKSGAQVELDELSYVDLNELFDFMRIHFDGEMFNEGTAVKRIAKELRGGDGSDK